MSELTEGGPYWFGPAELFCYGLTAFIVGLTIYTGYLALFESALAAVRFIGPVSRNVIIIFPLLLFLAFPIAIMEVNYRNGR